MKMPEHPGQRKLDLDSYIVLPILHQICLCNVMIDLVWSGMLRASLVLCIPLFRGTYPGALDCPIECRSIWLLYHTVNF